MSQARRARELATGTADSLFLPDFCAIRAVFGVVVIAELLAFVLVLSGAGHSRQLLSDLSLVSLFVQWVALTSAAVLCVLRRWLRSLGNQGVAVVSYALLLIVTLVLSEIAFRVLAPPDVVGVPLAPGDHLRFLLRNLAVSAIVSAVALRYFYVQYQWKRNLEAETQARLEALQARIRPHFLFNSMNTIASLTRSDPELAEQVVEDLADLFRVTLADARRLVSLDDELAHVRHYLNIEKLRLGERLTVTWDLPALSAPPRLPALTLQPLLENAIYHGIEPLPHGGTIHIGVAEAGGEVAIAVANPRPATRSSQRAPGTQSALDNVRQRLDAAFGGDRLTVRETAQTFEVQLRIPLALGAAT